MGKCGIGRLGSDFPALLPFSLASPDTVKPSLQKKDAEKRAVLVGVVSERGRLVCGAREPRTWPFHQANQCTIASRINVTPKGVNLPGSKPHSILAKANLLAHNNISQICYCGQILSQSGAVNCSFDTFGGNIYFAGDGTLSQKMMQFQILIQYRVI